MLKRTFKATVTAAVLGFGASAAQAGIFLSVGGTPQLNNGLVSNQCFANCTTNNFNSGLLPGNYVGNAAVVTGTIQGQWAQPTGPGVLFNNTAYLVTPATGSSGSVTITLPTLQNYFGFYAGSVDTYNTIAFFNGAAQVVSVSGAELIALPNPDTISGNQQQATYFNLTLTGSDVYNRIVLSTTQIAFETDNHTFGFAVVPVPASAVLLLSGLAGMVFASRRQKKGPQIA